MINKLQPNNFYRVKYSHKSLKRYFYCGEDILSPPEDELIIYYLGGSSKYIPDYYRAFYSFLYKGKMCFAEDGTGIFSNPNNFEKIS